MKAMIFAAGLGTRLRPHTLHRPKALVEIAGRPLLEWCILRLRHFGYRELIINVHHFADQIEAFLASRDQFGLTIHISDERDLLRETGGGVLYAGEWLAGEEPFLLCNADVLSDINLTAFRDSHLRGGQVASLAVHDRESSRYLIFDDQHRLAGWRNTKTGELRMSRKLAGPGIERAFSGYHYLSPDIFSLITETGKFSIIDLYLRLARDRDILAFESEGGFLLDVGKVENLPAAEKWIAEQLLPELGLDGS